MPEMSDLCYLRKPRMSHLVGMNMRSVHAMRLRNKRYVDGQNGCATILPITVPVKKIKDATRQCYGDGDGDGVVQCEKTFEMRKYSK